MEFKLHDFEVGTEFPVTFVWPSDEKRDELEDIDTIVNDTLLRIKEERADLILQEQERTKYQAALWERRQLLSNGYAGELPPLEGPREMNAEDERRLLKGTREGKRAERLRVRATFRAGIDRRTLTDRQKELVNSDPDGSWWKQQPSEIVEAGAGRFRSACDEGRSVDTTDPGVAAVPPPAAEVGRTGGATTTPLAVDTGADATV